MPSGYRTLKKSRKEGVIMAKRIISWKLEGTKLNLCRPVQSNQAIVIEKSFDLLKIFPDFEKLTDVQRELIIYGIKQKLADAGSQENSLDGKAVAAQDTWNDLAAGKWKGERSNGTGASENKKIATATKTILAEGISLNGLMMKKMLTPEKFTTEEQEHLDRLMKEAVKKMKN
jgi:hypothetical protein